MKNVDLNQALTTALITTAVLGVSSYAYYKYLDWRYGITSKQEALSPLLRFFDFSTPEIEPAELSGYAPATSIAAPGNYMVRRR